MCDVRLKNWGILTSAKADRTQDRLVLHFADGELGALPEGKGPTKRPVAKRAKSSYVKPGQPGLFDDPGANGDA